MKAEDYKIRDCVPFQTCPKCDGQGIVSKPDWVTGDINQWSGTGISYECNVCYGKKIIPMFIISEENEDIKLIKA